MNRNDVSLHDPMMEFYDPRDPFYQCGAIVNSQGCRPAFSGPGIPNWQSSDPRLRPNEIGCNG